VRPKFRPPPILRRLERCICGEDTDHLCPNCLREAQSKRPGTPYPSDADPSIVEVERGGWPTTTQPARTKETSRPAVLLKRTQ
jgi:hypothetical protein